MTKQPPNFKGINMRKALGSFFVIWIFVIILGTIGEIKCIIHFCECDFEAPYKEECIYGISMVTGIGAVTGWIDFGK